MPMQNILLPQKIKRNFVSCEEIWEFISGMSRDQLLCMDFTEIPTENSHTSDYVSESDTQNQVESGDRRSVGYEAEIATKGNTNLHKVPWIFTNVICPGKEDSEIIVRSPEKTIHLFAPYLAKESRSELVLVGLAQGRLQRVSILYLGGFAEEMLQILDFLRQELLVGSDSFYVLQRKPDKMLLVTGEDQDRMQRFAVTAELLHKVYADHLLWSQKGSFVSCRESYPELFDPYRIPLVELEETDSGGE